MDHLLRAIFNGLRKTGRLDPEAIEMLVRSAMHQAGAAALTELLRFAAPTGDQRTLPCGCGQQALRLLGPTNLEKLDSPTASASLRDSGRIGPAAGSARRSLNHHRSRNTRTPSKLPTSRNSP